MVFSYEELKSMKYVELLKISKSLQLKGARQKTEKLIKLIIRQQLTLKEDDAEFADKDETTEMLEDVEFPEHPLLSDDETSDPITYTKKDVKHEGNGKRKRSFDSVDNGASSSISLRRSNTFVVDKPLSKKIKSSEEKDQPIEGINARRSETSDKCPIRPRILDAEDLQSACKRRRLSGAIMPKKPDLTCSEVLTAADIKDLEESPLNTAFKSGGVKSNVTARRSLRGYLLNARLSRRISTFDAIPSPVIRERASKFIEPLPKTSTIPKAINDKKCNNVSFAPGELRRSSPKFISKTIVNTQKQVKEETNKDNVNGKSSIPRFVAYARKLKVPNFSRIHEKNFDRMEGVGDYLERKQNRARNAQTSFCLSSSKKDASVFKPTVTSTKDINLNFTGNLPPLTLTPYTTGLNKSVNKQNGSNMNPTKTLNVKNSKDNQIRAKVKLDFNKLPDNVPLRGRKPINRRGDSRPAFSKTETFKAAAKKLPKVTSNNDLRARQSTFLKGVRLNKRFELQMAKRGIKLN